ncbi:unnamed protein product [Adineta ricciae]|uniref:G-protein coupled receptors family 1 profile domain-containing protein n=1 Tax=Adineta ricciae TaxID=249248 RepID=A0A814W1B4_ADIRI|nr:unnamed protein product [Adineta ricciae]
MGTMLYYPSSFLQLTNQTSMDEHDYSINNSSLNLFIFATVWFILILTTVCGSIGNLLVLYVYINRDDNKTCSFFIKMLAVVDFIICSVLVPLELYQTTTGIRNEFLCKFYGFLHTHVLYSTFLITTIAFDRYFCICWPLYKIITIRRARIIVLLCGLLSSLLALIPMSEYSTTEHILHLHNNHSNELFVGNSQEDLSIVYAHVEHISTSVDKLPFTIGNLTHVKCSPKFSLHLNLSRFFIAYRIFHSTLFAICIIIVVILYLFIYNAIYQRRRTRTKRISTYQKILQSYFINNSQNRSHTHRNSLLACLCCCCCQDVHVQTVNQSFDEDDEEHRPKHSLRQQSLMRNKPEHIILEIHGARGKRYSAVSMTSMTYLTSGVWDDTSSANLVRSRVNSIAANTYCGTEHSLTDRSLAVTEDLLDHTAKPSQLRPPHSTYLTVPGKPMIPLVHANETSNKDNHMNENESSGNISPSVSLLHPTVTRKSSHSPSTRSQHQHPSDSSVIPRKIRLSSFSSLSSLSLRIPLNKSEINKFCFSVTSSGTTDHCIIEDLPSVNHSLGSPSHHQLNIHFNNHHSLSSDPRRQSNTSIRHGSTFDLNCKEIFERQQKQERSANIRTTLTLFIVTATFILIYSPSIIITLFNIKPNLFREPLFLLYYINSACNPLIYSFFNINFRNDIRRIYECQKRVYLARQC